MPHWLYLTTSYYEKWLYCYEKILEAKGVVKPGEIDRQIAAQSVPPIVDHPSMPDTVSGRMTLDPRSDAATLAII
jgi:Nitrile hydratase beta subunit